MSETLAPLAIVLVVAYCSVEMEETPKRVCRYLGKEFSVGELVMGDECDRCYCTKDGLMCEMLKCPTANCYDKVKRKCCFECPNGPNCLYEGEDRTVLVPGQGCTYSKGVVCHCYYDNSMADKEETVCMPAFPGDSLPPCKALEP